MTDERNTGGLDDGKPSTGPGASQPGTRMDKFLSGAQRLGNTARQMASEAADAAGPKLKDLREAATAHGNRMFEGVPPGSPLGKVRAFFTSGGRARKGLMIYGGGMGVLLVISLVMMPIVLLMPHSAGPDRANLDKVQSGMTEGQVDKLLGTPSAADKRPDGSLAKTWTPTATNDGPIHVTFVDGKVATKVMDETTAAPAAVASTPPAAQPAVATAASSAPPSPPSNDGELVAKDVPDSFMHSAKHAAELHARDYADRLRPTLEGGDADFYSVEKTEGADGNVIPNEYVAVIYVKTGTNAFGVHRNVTMNLFYRYKPDTKELWLVETKEADHGFAK
jgi:hypothetical protein